MQSQGVTIQNTNNIGTRSFRVLINYSNEDNCYIANIPTLSYCTTYGDTVEEAMINIKEAAEGVVETMIANGWPIPDDSNTIEYSLQVPLILQTA